MLGVLLPMPDAADGVLRRESLAFRYADQVYPSMALMLAARSLNLPPEEIRIAPEQGELRLGRLHIATDAQGRMLSYFYRNNDGKSAFPVDSFFDVYSGKGLAPDKYRDRIVLIGTSAAGVGSHFATPVAAQMPPVLTLAHAVSSILQEDGFVRPQWLSGQGWEPRC